MDIAFASQDGIAGEYIGEDIDVVAGSQGAD